MKRELCKHGITLAVFTLLLGGGAWAQQPGSQEGAHGNVQLDRSESVPTFRVTVVSRTTKAINYRHRSGSTNVDLRGTALMPMAKGEAVVNSKQGRIEINARMDHMTPATQYGPEYLTYVMWAVTPEGRPKNLGEVLLNGDNSKLDVTTDLQTFGIIITAEPYFAVSQPSDLVVMENFIRADTQGTYEDIDAKYELLGRGEYVVRVPTSEIQAYTIDHKVPLELYEARNAIRIAQWTGADRYAADTFDKAKIGLLNAEEELHGKIGKKTISQNSRDAAQNAEDARLITLRKMQEEYDAGVQAAADKREAEARAQAEQADAQREAAERAKAQVQAEADRAAKDAEAARAAALAQQQQAQAQLDQARQAAEQAEQEKAQLREQLRQQLNLILETRETARGLIVNMSDVLFDSGRYTLKAGAREKLAKIGGIILAHPGLTLVVEGHTDSVGGDEYNLKLSEQRANSVRDYLVSEGVAGDSIIAAGLGKAGPVADNSTPTGRQQNRRVELVVSGDPIGAAASRNPASQ